MSLPGTQTTATNWAGVSYGIVLGYVAAYFQFKVPPVLPVMLGAYHYDTFVAGGFMSIFAVAGMAVSVRVGRAIRRDGATRYLAGAFALMIAGSVLGLAAPDSGAVMLAARTIEGLGAAVLAVCMPAFVNMNASPSHLPIVIAVQATWIPVGQLTANLIAQPAVAVGLWQPVWWAGIAATGAIALWSVVLARRDRVRFTASTNPSQAAAPASAVTPAERQRLFIAAVLFFLWQAQFMAYFTWLPVYLVDVRGISADGAVLINQLPVVVLLVFAVATGFVLRAGVGTLPLLVAALALQAASWLLVPLADNVAIGTISLIAWGVAAGITPTCLWALPSVLLGGHRADTHAFAVVLTGRYLGILAGPLAAAGAYRLTGEWLAVAYSFGAVTVVCAAVAFHLDRLVKRPGSAPTA